MNIDQLGKQFSEDAETKRLSNVVAVSLQQIKVHAINDLLVASAGCTAALQVIEAEDRAAKAIFAFAEHALRFARTIEREESRRV